MVHDLHIVKTSLGRSSLWNLCGRTSGIGSLTHALVALGFAQTLKQVAAQNSEGSGFVLGGVGEAFTPEIAVQ